MGSLTQTRRRKSRSRSTGTMSYARYSGCTHFVKWDNKQTGGRWYECTIGTKMSDGSTRFGLMKDPKTTSTAVTSHCWEMCLKLTTRLSPTGTAGDTLSWQQCRQRSLDISPSCIRMVPNAGCLRGTSTSFKLWGGVK